ncbi:hypothetical protein [Flavobacterium panacagri]|nr:hypothetical protein [Flavobacterium panacagri]
MILKKGSYETECPSPDRSGILFLPSLGRKRYSGWLEIAPYNSKN